MQPAVRHRHGHLRLHHLRVGHVARDRHRLATRRRDPVRHLLRDLLLQVGRDDGRARRRKVQRNCLADARTRAGDKGGLAVKS